MALASDAPWRMPLAKKRKPRNPSPHLFLGEWIIRLDRKRPELAVAVGITPTHMSEIISGKKYPSPGLMFAIADELGITVDDLRRPPPPRLAVEAAERLAPNQLSALGALLNQIKKPPGK